MLVVDPAGVEITVDRNRMHKDFEGTIKSFLCYGQN